MPASPKRKGAGRGSSPPKLTLLASKSRLRAKRLLLGLCAFMVGIFAVSHMQRKQNMLTSIPEVTSTKPQMSEATSAEPQRQHRGPFSGEGTAEQETVALGSTYISKPGAGESPPPGVATPASARAKRSVRIFHHAYDHSYEKVWATVDLLQYASLIQEDVSICLLVNFRRPVSMYVCNSNERSNCLTVQNDVDAGWSGALAQIKPIWQELSEARESGDTSGKKLPMDLFSQFESEFALALTMLTINVSNV